MTISLYMAAPKRSTRTALEEFCIASRMRDQNAGVTLDIEKGKFLRSSVKVSAHGIQPDLDQVAAITWDGDPVEQICSESGQQH